MICAKSSQTLLVCNGDSMVYGIGLVSSCRCVVNLWKYDTLTATIGTVIPMLFKRIRIDPAIANVPFATTSIDIIGIMSYFIIAHAFLF